MRGMGKTANHKQMEMYKVYPCHQKQLNQVFQNKHLYKIQMNLEVLQNTEIILVIHTNQNKKEDKSFYNKLKSTLLTFCK